MYEATWEVVEEGGEAGGGAGFPGDGLIEAPGSARLPDGGARSPRRLALDLRIEQVQGEPPFRMPLDVEIKDIYGRVRYRVIDSLRVQNFRLPLRAEPLGLRLDPDDWILTHVVHGSSVEETDAIAGTMGLPFPSPGAPPFRIDLPGLGEPRVEVLDAAGRRVRVIAGTAGGGHVVWDGRDARGHDLPSGLYLVRLAGERAGAGKRPGARKLWLVR
jgi:hypothetical protein